MTWRITVILSLAMTFGVTVSEGQWQLRVHREGHSVEFELSEIDSLTLYQFPIPMVIVPAGTFLMGDGVAECGEDEREVTLTRDLYLGQHQVTNQEYLEAVQWAYDHGYVTATISSVQDNLDGSTEKLLDLADAEGDCEISFSDGIFVLRDAGHGVNPNHPVIEATWFGAARYCDWLSIQAGFPRAYEHDGDWLCNGNDPYAAQGYRLPTDAEWEYAAQFDDERIYPWGDEAPDCGGANYRVGAPYCVGWTSPVGSYPDAPEELGLLDMAGNVWEWCNDRWVCDLGTEPATDPTGGPSSETRRVIHGGSWDHQAVHLRCSYRILGSYPYASNPHIGFRVARTRP